MPECEVCHNEYDKAFQVVAQGTTHMRGHVTVDATVGLETLEAMQAVRDEYRDLVEIQLALLVNSQPRDFVTFAFQ